MLGKRGIKPISIHAPSRERRNAATCGNRTARFQSTLPHGSDLGISASALSMYISIHAPSRERRRHRLGKLPEYDFNPRSLTGATERRLKKMTINAISIHAPSRERLALLRGGVEVIKISIHAPSRERLRLSLFGLMLNRFQSTLPHGSDTSCQRRNFSDVNFNPRSLTGATAN